MSCIASLKDYGDYYQLSICKFLNDKKMYPDEEIERMFEFGAKNRVEARQMLQIMRTDGRFLFDSPLRAPDEFTEKEGRFINALVRARSVISQLGALNPWQWFVTFTINPEKFDRYDFGAFYKKFSVFKQHYKRDYGVKFDYVLVPEQHQDGAWHLHGLVNNLPVDHLKEYQLKDFFPFTDVKLPTYIRDKLGRGEKVYSWPVFADRFGWTVIEPIQDSSKASNYITKYIGKGFACNDRFKGARLFIPSLGLQRAVQIKKGFSELPSEKPSFENEFVSVFKFPKSDYVLSDLENLFY